MMMGKPEAVSHRRAKKPSPIAPPGVIVIGGR